MTLSDHVICMAFGEKIAEGTPNQITSNQAVIDAYLGGTDDD
jgi:ABC-type branched-subunit amino acid transport system ATPase component